MLAGKCCDEILVDNTVERNNYWYELSGGKSDCCVKVVILDPYQILSLIHCDDFNRESESPYTTHDPDFPTVFEVLLWLVGYVIIFEVDSDLFYVEADYYWESKWIYGDP